MYSLIRILSAIARSLILTLSHPLCLSVHVMKLWNMKLIRKMIRIRPTTMKRVERKRDKCRCFTFPLLTGPVSLGTSRFKAKLFSVNTKSIFIFSFVSSVYQIHWCVINKRIEWSLSIRISIRHLSSILLCQWQSYSFGMRQQYTTLFRVLNGNEILQSQQWTQKWSAEMAISPVYDFFWTLPSIDKIMVKPVKVKTIEIAFSLWIPCVMDPIGFSLKNFLSTAFYLLSTKCGFDTWKFREGQKLYNENHSDVELEFLV